jgi:tetratricopeptide (TPR) repeat protein
MAPKLTLCLITKNEEALLPGCLDSVKGVVDEIVLVDTGSTDRTMELARAAGATVLERPWDDDFAAPRNLAARHAKGGWILMLDADERLAPGAGRALHRKSGFHLGMSAPQHTRRQPPRSLRQAGTARPWYCRSSGTSAGWSGVIYNPTGGGCSGQAAGCSTWTWSTSAYPRLLRDRDKRRRNIALLRRRCELEAEDITPYSYLALELQEDGKYEEAAAVIAQAWAMLDRQPPYRCFHRLSAARGILALRKADAALARETGLVAEAHNGPHPDFDYLKGFADEIGAMRATPRSEERVELLRKAAASFEAALRRLASDGPFEYLGSVNEVRCHLHLGVIRLMEGRPQDSLKAFTEALRVEPKNPSARVGAAEALVELGDAAKALQIVEPASGPLPTAGSSRRRRPSSWGRPATRAALGRSGTARATSACTAGPGTGAQKRSSPWQVAGGRHHGVAAPGRPPNKPGWRGAAEGGTRPSARRRATDRLHRLGEGLGDGSEDPLSLPGGTCVAGERRGRQPQADEAVDLGEAIAELGGLAPVQRGVQLDHDVGGLHERWGGLGRPTCLQGGGARPDVPEGRLEQEHHEALR